jgi:outer membrane lipoprotein SlyB
MNKYLEKIAFHVSEENKSVARTVAEDAAASLPAAAAGGWIGNKIGQRYGKGSLGTFVGSHVLGGIAGIAAVKHSLHGKIAEK